MIGYVYLGYSKYVYGDTKEREELLAATVLYLAEKNYTKNDVIEISTEYDPFKGGIYPYNYRVRVVTKDKPDEIKSYTWVDSNKKEVDIAAQAYK